MPSDPTSQHSIILPPFPLAALNPLEVQSLFHIFSQHIEASTIVIKNNQQQLIKQIHHLDQLFQLYCADVKYQLFFFQIFNMTNNNISNDAIPRIVLKENDTMVNRLIINGTPIQPRPIPFPLYKPLVTHRIISDYLSLCNNTSTTSDTDPTNTLKNTQSPLITNIFEHITHATADQSPQLNNPYEPSMSHYKSVSSHPHHHASRMSAIISVGKPTDKDDNPLNLRVLINRVNNLSQDIDQLGIRIIALHHIMFDQNK